jgi:hypothetical protein
MELSTLISYTHSRAEIMSTGDPCHAFRALRPDSFSSQVQPCTALRSGSVSAGIDIASSWSIFCTYHLMWPNFEEMAEHAAVTVSAFLVGAETKHVYRRNTRSTTIGYWDIPERCFFTVAAMTQPWEEKHCSTCTSRGPAHCVRATSVIANACAFEFAYSRLCRVTGS